jgi:hypothetical protein
VPITVALPRATLRIHCRTMAVIFPAATGTVSVSSTVTDCVKASP